MVVEVGFGGVEGALVLVGVGALDHGVGEVGEGDASLYQVLAQGADLVAVLGA